MTPRDTERLDELLSLVRSDDASDRDLVVRAYTFSKQAHHGQKRLSGKPYFLHVYATARILARLGMDAQTIGAGFLHDTIEDGTATEKEIGEEFGEEVLFLVQGVTKLGKLKYQGLHRHTESLRKLFVAISEDIRVLVIKLADRLHNMKTLEYVPEEKRRRIALETLEIYAPLAHRFGISVLKGELEDRAFKYLHPKEFDAVSALLKKKSKENMKRLVKVSRTLLRLLAEAKIKTIKTDYRIKHKYSLYKKLKRKDMNIEKVYDVAALRIIVSSIEDCYRCLGIIHHRFKPVPERIKDYIASPKPNGYRSLHTTIFTGDGAIVEIQIKTPEMHQEAEYGVASHVSYKEGTHKGVWFTRIPAVGKEGTAQNKTLTPPWFRELAELQKHVEEPEEFIRNLTHDFFGERVFVCTPKGEVIDLPRGATPIDFAYAIHSDIGDHLSGAKVNGKLVSIETELENGDVVFIATKQTARPSKKWLGYVKTTLARKHIRARLKA